MDTKAKAKIEVKGTVAKKPTAKAPVQVAVKETAPAVPAKAAPVKEAVLAAPDEAVVRSVVYQPSAQVLARDAESNERFGVGDAMPVYYL